MGIIIGNRYNVYTIYIIYIKKTAKGDLSFIECRSVNYEWAGCAMVFPTQEC